MKTDKKKFFPIIPLIFHRIILNKALNWEDVHKEILKKILFLIGDDWFVLNNNNEKMSLKWMITFDDGFASDYEIVFPLLKENKIKGTFFISIDKVGTEGYLTWPQILEMHKYGMHIGSHGLTHKSMNSLTKNMLRKEFRNSKLILEDFLGDKVISFSYPYGSFSKYTNKIGIDEGYEFLCNSQHGIYDGINHLIPRNSINSKMDWENVIDIMNPNFKRKIIWKIEDYFKEVAKYSLGPDLYKKIRNRLT